MVGGQYLTLSQRFYTITRYVKDLIYEIVSVVAIIAYFVPLAIVLLKKLWQVTPFLLFALYWLLGGLVNLVDLEWFQASKRTIEITTVFYNMLDMPIVMAVLYITTSSTSIRKFIAFALPAFVVLEVVSVGVRGLNYEALKYTLAIGLLLILTLIVWEIILYLQKVVHTSRERGLLFIYAALLFEYGTYVIIYIFDYYLTHISSTIDNYLVYYISSLIAIVIATCGYLTKGIDKKPRFLGGGWTRD